eukprot:m.168279 g.168279  ORF g.168279 m.168279 type:complete len:525 (+) comp9906_c1_seq5:3-1577(+)
MIVTAKHVSLGYGLVLMLCAGTPYMFGMFNNKLHYEYGLSQTQTLLIETSVQVGLFSGILQGIFFDRFGPRHEALLAAGLVFLGYLGSYLLLTSSASAALLALCFYLIGQGSHGLYTVAAMTNVPNFLPAQQGTVMGLLAGAFGLSAALFASVENAIDGAAATVSACDRNSTAGNSTAVETEHSGAGFFLLCSLLFGAVGLGAAVAVRRVPLPGRSAPLASKEDALSLEGLGGDFILVPTEEPSHAETRLDSYSNEGADDVFMDSPKSSVVGVSDSIDRSPGPAATADEDDKTALIAPEEESPSHAPGPARLQPGAIDITGTALLRTANFWLLFVALAIDDGSAVMFLNAIQSMRGAAGDASTDPGGTALVAVFSFCNAGGRVLWGLLSDRSGLQRVTVLLITIVGMMTGHIMLILLPAQLMLACVLIGTFFGGLIAIAPVMVSDLFGYRYYGTNWGFIVLAPATGSVLFGFLYGAVFDLHATHIGDCLTCHGVECYRPVFYVTTALLAVAAAVTVVLARRIRS